MDVGKPQRTIVVEPIESPVPAEPQHAAAAPDLIEPVAGWRLWSLARTRAGLRLASPVRDAPWTPGHAHVAACGHGHEAPRARCDCGVHALRRPDGLFRCLGLEVAPPSPYVVGLVALWGRVVECERGWRGERAAPLRLVVAGTDGLAELAAGLAGYGCAVETAASGVADVVALLERPPVGSAR
jgi:hypothetical protein